MAVSRAAMIQSRCACSFVFCKELFADIISLVNMLSVIWSNWL